MKPYQTIFTPVRLLLLSVLIILLWVMLTPSTFAAAGIRRTINFQGKLVNKSDGTNITDGSYTFIFKFYDASSLGTQLPSGTPWSETQTITVTNGIFRAELGSVTSIPTTLDFNSDSIYLDITFNSENFGSRVRMTAVPYAFNAEKVSGLTVTNTTGTLTIPNSKTISFADAFTTSGAFPLTLTSSATTNATLPPGTITLVDLAATQTLTNKSIGSTGLTFSGATTDITTGTNEDFAISPNGTGKVPFTVGNATGNGVSVAAASLTTGSAFNVTATSTPTGVSSTSNGVTLALTQAAATNATTYTGLNLQYTQNPTVSGNTSYAAQIQNQVTANITDNTVAALLRLDNADTSATGSTVVTDALRIENSGAIAAGVTNGIAFRSTTIGTGINFVSTPTTNYISGTNFTVASGGNITTAGNLTFTNAATVSLTASSTTALNVQSGLLDLDTTNSRVGIGNSAPAANLDVGPGTLGASQIVQIRVGDFLMQSQQGASNGLSALTSRGSNGNMTIDGASGSGVYTAPFTTNNTFLSSGGGKVAVGSGNAPATRLDVTGLTLNTDADATVGAANFTYSLTKNDANVRAFPGVNIKPTINTGVSNASTTLNVLNIDTTNTATTGVTTNLIKASYGGSQAFLVSSAGAITAATSTNTINGLIVNSSTQTLGANTITDSGALTITSTGANTLALDSGTTGNVTLGANANAKTITVGNVTGATTLNLKAGTGSILLAGAATGTSATYLGLPVKTDAGDPTTTQINGAMYYNSSLGFFRCFQASAWTNCIGSSSGATGSGVANQVTYWSGTNTVAGNAGLTFNPGSTSGNTLALSNTSLTTGSAFNVTATSTPTTLSSTSNGVTLALTQAAATNATTYTGLNLQYTQNPTVAGNTSYAAQIQNQVTANITDNTVAALLRLDNADTSATGSTVVTDGLRIDNSGAISGGIVNGIAFRATTITNGLNFVSTPATNYITGTNFTVASGGNITTAGNLTFTNAATVSLTASSTTALNIQSGLLDFDTTNSRVGIGTTAPSAALHVLKTTEQLRLGYDATNFQSFTVNSTAGLTIKTAVDSTGALLYTNSANGSLLNVDSTNSIIDLLANNTGELKAWQTNTNNLNTAMGDFGTATYHGYVYAVGGYSQALAGAQTTVQYAKLNADGSTGAWATLNSLPAARSGCGTFAVNGYLYCVNGYNSGAFSSVYYAKINQDGTLGTWQTQSSNLPQNASFDSGYFEANGYIYLVGGAGAGVASQQWVQYARVLANGGTGAWTLLSTALVTAETAPATVYANGYVYAIGGYGTNSSGSATTNVQYAKVNTDGSLGSFTDQVSNKLGLARGYALGATANGYVYVMGGNNASDTNTVQYSKITISDHSLGAWTTSTRNLPGTKELVGSTPVVNGYVYFYGGANGAADTNTVYYASVAKLKIGGALDLVGDSNAVDLADGRSSGQLTSGSHDVIGDLSVRGDAIVRGGLDIQGLSYFNDDVSFTKNRMTAGGSVTYDDGTATTANSDLPLGRLKEYFSGAGYGVFESTGFINLQGSFLMENFIQERASITGENTNLTNHFGDQFEWNLRTLGTGVGTNTTGTSPCNVGQNTDVVPTNNLNGVLEAQPANSTSTNGQGGNCYLYMGVSTLSGTNTPGNAMLRVANKFIMYYKFKPSAQVTNTPSQKYMFLGADNYVQGWFGMPTQTETGKGGMWLANITATGSNGSANTVWNGIVKNGTSTTTASFSCSSGNANINTNAYAIARLEARATNDFRFFLDSDISNGVNLSNCTAQATSNIITSQIRPAMMFANLSPQSASATWAMFVDLFAYVQDDPLPSGNGSSQALVSDQPAPAEQPSAISGADLAEQYFMPNSNAGPGDVVMMGSSPGLAVPADKPYDHNMLGVVSESPGLQIGVANSQTKPIALTGRVPVRVTTKNGEIKKGDPITSSDIPGVAMKATKAGKILGTAMEDYASHDEGKIMVNINVSYYIGQENDTAFIEKGADVLGLSDKPVASLSGKLASDSAQIASGSASLAQSFESLKDLIFKGAVEFWNKVTFKGVAEYLAEVFFRQNVHFDGQVEFNSDSAGYAKIKEGERFVEVKFDKEYKNEPIVNISISLPRVTEETFKGYIASGQCDAAAGINACQDKIASQVLSEDMKAAVAAKTTQGFVILLNKASPVDITFSWQAVAVKEAKTTVSKSTDDLVKDLEKTASSSAQTGQVAGESTSSAVLQIKNTLEKEASKSSQLQGDASVDSKKGTIKQTDLGYVRLRSKSSVDGEELAQIPSGTDITYTAVENGWYQVSFEGKTGWVSGEYVK